MADQREPAAVALRRLANGYQISQALHVAVTLGIPDLLGDAPRGSDDLAAETGAHPGSLYRLLRALAAVGVLREDEERTFTLTELGEGLRTDAPEGIGGWIAFVGRPSHWQAWGDLLHSVRTGENAFRHVHGMDVWSYRADRPEESAIFDGAMQALTRSSNAALMEAYDFGRFGTIVDVGGGNGTLLVIERALGPPNEDLRTKLSDLNMLVAAGGRERTEEEFESLLAAAGFRLVGATPTASGLSVIESAPD